MPTTGRSAHMLANPTARDLSSTQQVAQSAHLVQVQQDSGLQLIEAALPLLLELHDLVPDSLQPGWAGLLQSNVSRPEGPSGLPWLLQDRACGRFAAACLCAPNSVSSRLTVPHAEAAPTALQGPMLG